MMLHQLSTWLVAVGFFGAGVVNIVGRPSMQDRFAGWGYPRWWCRVTGAAEIASAVLIAFPPTRTTGLAVGAIIIAAALATVLRNRDFHHLPPIGLFIAMIGFASVS